jgi:curved DNA-binding protein CbpA
MALNYYEILDVDPKASSGKITRAFRKKSLVYHPDKPGGCAVKFKELNQAYSCKALGENSSSREN